MTMSCILGECHATDKGRCSKPSRMLQLTGIFGLFVVMVTSFPALETWTVPPLTCFAQLYKFAFFMYIFIIVIINVISHHP